MGYCQPQSSLAEASEAAPPPLENLLERHAAVLTHSAMLARMSASMALGLPPYTRHVPRKLPAIVKRKHIPNRR